MLLYIFLLLITSQCGMCCFGSLSGGGGSSGMGLGGGGSNGQVPPPDSSSFMRLSTQSLYTPPEKSSYQVPQTSEQSYSNQYVASPAATNEYAVSPATNYDPAPIVATNYAPAPIAATNYAPAPVAAINYSPAELPQDTIAYANDQLVQKLNNNFAARSLVQQESSLEHEPAHDSIFPVTGNIDQDWAAIPFPEVAPSAPDTSNVIQSETPSSMFREIIPYNFGSSTKSMFLDILDQMKVFTMAYDSAGFWSENGAPIMTPGRLTCDFETDCCFTNAASPEDQLDWIEGEGDVDIDTLSQTFNTADPPRNKFLIAMSPEATGEARFTSCTVACTDEEVYVTARHWTTRDAEIQVCSREAFFENGNSSMLLNCQVLSPISSPGPSRIVFPPGEYFDIIFIAVFHKMGGVAMLDDIEVQYSVCDWPPEPETVKSSEYSNVIEEQHDDDSQFFTTAAPVILNDQQDNDADFLESSKSIEKTILNEIDLNRPIFKNVNEDSFEGAEAVTINEQVGTTVDAHSGHAGSHDLLEQFEKATNECEFIACDFENGNMCNYIDATNSGQGFMHGINVKFNVQTGKFMNRVTGISKAGEGEHYLASYLEPGDVSALNTYVTLEADRIISMQYYVVTQGIQMRACCDTFDRCPFVSPEGEARQRFWKEAKFYCPSGTNMIHFICENLGIYEGACGLDNLRISTETEENICLEENKLKNTDSDPFGEGWTYL